VIKTLPYSLKGLNFLAIADDSVDETIMLFELLALVMSEEKLYTKVLSVAHASYASIYLCCITIGPASKLKLRQYFLSKLL
jgi:hypothetical protein